MNVMHWRFYALALYAVGLVACSDQPTAPKLEQPEADVVSVPSRPVAQRASNDPTAIPIGSPARIEFFGTAAASRHTLTFPLRPQRVDGEQLAQAITTWLARVKPTHANGASDLVTARVVRSVEAVLGARSPEEVRALLGPARARIADDRSVRPVGGGLIEHTASYRLDGRELLRVVTNTRQAIGGPRFYCAEEPTEFQIDPCLGGGDPDPHFDPAPIAADMAAMQAEVDGMTADLASLQAFAGTEWIDCDADRAAYIGASLAFLWYSGEAVYFAWRRDVPNTYRAVRIASLSYGVTLAAYLKYRQCLRGQTRPRL